MIDWSWWDKLIFAAMQAGAWTYLIWAVCNYARHKRT